MSENDPLDIDKRLASQMMAMHGLMVESFLRALLKEFPGIAINEIELVETRLGDSTSYSVRKKGTV